MSNHSDIEELLIAADRADDQHSGDAEFHTFMAELAEMDPRMAELLRNGGKEGAT